VQWSNSFGRRPVHIYFSCRKPSFQIFPRAKIALRDNSEKLIIPNQHQRSTSQGQDKLPGIALTCFLIWAPCPFSINAQFFKKERTGVWKGRIKTLSSFLPGVGRGAAPRACAPYFMGHLLLIVMGIVPLHAFVRIVGWRITRAFEGKDDVLVESVVKR